MRIAVAALLSVAFVLHAAFIFEQSGSPAETFFRDNDAFDSSRFLADARVIESDGLYGGVPKRQVHAVYPLMIAVFEKAFGPAPVAFLLFQALLNCAVFFLVWRLARRWFGDREALVALAICAFASSFVFHAGVWLREVTALFFAVALLALLDEWRHRGGGWLLALAAGSAMGLLMETRPYPLVLATLLALFAWSMFRRRTFDPVASLAAFAGGTFGVMFLIPAPGAESPTGALEHFLSGNVLDGAYGYLWLTTPAKERLLAESGGSALKGLWLFLGEVVRQPLAYGLFYVKKLRMLFGDFAIPSNYNIYLFKEELSSAIHLPFITFGMIFPFALAGIWEGWRARQKLWGLYLIAFALTVGVFIFPIQERYRLIMVPCYILFAAHGACQLYDAAREGMMRRTAYLSALFLAALFICRFDYAPLTGIIGLGDYKNLAIAYRLAGDDVKGRYYAMKAVEAGEGAR